MFEIYTYGGGTYLVELFTSLSLLLGSDDFSTLVRIAGLLGIIWIGLEAFGRRLNTQLDLMYFIRFALVYMALLVPKVDVAIVDRINPVVAGPVVVEDVPLGLGVLAHLTSTIGDGLTRMYETNISIPGDLKYEATGLLLGSSLIRSGSDINFADANYATHMNAWLQQCGFWQMTRGLITPDELVKSEDIWGLLSDRASTLRYVDLGILNPATGDNFWSCKEAVDGVLEPLWAAQIDGAATLWGRSVWTGKNAADARAAVLGTASGAYTYLGASSRGASDLIQQHLMINAVKQGLVNFAASSDATAATVNIAQTQAEASQRTTYQVMGNMAGKMLPIMRNVIEAVVYGLFPIAAIFMLLPSGGIAFLFYAKVLLWLQLWAPLYAILNSMMTWYGQYKNGAVSMLNPADGSFGLSLETVHGLAGANADLLAMAGYMAISVPMIAWMLVQAGAVAGTAVASHLAAPAQSAAQSAATAAASGNISLGNLSSDNTARNTWRANKLDSNIESASGGMAVQTGSGAIVRSYGHGGSGAIYDKGNSIPDPGANANVKGAISSSWSQASRRADMAAESSSVASSLALASALDQYTAYDRSRATSAAARTSASAGTDGSVGSGAGEMAKFVEQFGSDHKWSSSQSATLLAAVSASTPSIGVLKASGLFQGKSDAQLQSALDDTQKYMKEHNWQEKYDLMRKGSTGEAYEGADTGSRTALAGARASLQESDRFSRDATLSRQQSAAFEQAAQAVRNSALETGTSFNRTMMQDLERAGVSSARWDGLNDAQRDRLVNGWAQDYVAAHANEILHRNGIAPVNGNAAGEFHAAASQNPGFDSRLVTGHHATTAGEVRDQQQAAGLTPGTMPVDRVTAEARQIQREAQGHIDNTHVGITSRGAQVQGAAEFKTDAPWLINDAVAGGATQVLNVDTPLGNPGQKLKEVLGELGIGVTPRANSEHGATGSWPGQPVQSNTPPADWGKGNGR